MKPVIYAVLFFIASMFIFWLFGVDFDHRGIGPGCAVLESLAVAASGFVIGKIEK